MTINTVQKTQEASFESNVNVKSSWLASLSLTFSHDAYGTHLIRAKRSGPLSVQKAFYPEGKDCAHIYLLHPPAGIVSGDELSVTIDVNENAHSLITTPGANRFYRAREDLNIGHSKQEQHCIITIDKGAICENFPQETIVYEGADGFNTVDIHIDDESCYLGWDISSLGLPSSNQPFNLGSYRQLNRVYRNESLVYHDRIAIEPNSNIQHHKAGLNQCNVFATFLAYAPRSKYTNEQLKSHSEELKEHLNSYINNTMYSHLGYEDIEKKISISLIRELLVIRYLGNQAEECKVFFTFLWQKMRPFYINKEGVAPRIWHT